MLMVQAEDQDGCGYRSSLWVKKVQLYYNIFWGPKDYIEKPKCLLPGSIQRSKCKNTSQKSKQRTMNYDFILHECTITLFFMLNIICNYSNAKKINNNASEIHLQD